MSGQRHDGAQDPSATKSCDQCRKRKIRCDKSSPCSACITARHACTIGRWKHLRQPRSRTLISDQYEKKVDLLDARLRSIETTLQKLAFSASLPPENSVSGSEPAGDAVISPSSEHPRNDETVLGGDHALNVQTAQANDFLEKAVTQGRVREVNPSISAALINVRHLVERQRVGPSTTQDQSFLLQRSVPDGGVSKLPMPSIAVVLDLLNRDSHAQPTLFAYNCAFVGITNFRVLCEAVYASPQTSSHAEMTIVNAGLYYMLVEQDPSAKSSVSQNEYQSFARLCQGNLEICIQRFPRFLSANVKNIQALLLSVLYAIDTCRPSIAWCLNCAAADLCISGGFHRSDCIGRDQQWDQLKTSLFWQVYTMDKCLSLRLGQASVIQDWDISIPKQFQLDENQQRERVLLPKVWLTTSSLRARVYEQLYSPEALSASPDEHIERARSVAIECLEMEEEVIKARSMAFTHMDMDDSPNLTKIFFMSSLVQFYALKTLVFRIIPAPGISASRFCEESLQSARNAMEHHLNSVGLLGSGPCLQAMYVHWTLMMTPFAPFFLLFCHAIETLDMRDLGTLCDFTESLKTLRGASAAAEELFLLCQAMCDAAQAYQADAFQIQPERELNDFDANLCQMGLGPYVWDADGTQTMDMAAWFFGI